MIILCLERHKCGLLITKENGQDIQVGIVNYGNEQCPSNWPGIFTKVYPFKTGFTKLWTHILLQYHELSNFCKLNNLLLFEDINFL